jgi:3-oxo-5-alpha-steroid 4-dehydrogenase 1
LEKFVYNILLISLFIISALVFAILFFINAPYGRFTRSDWGIRINPKIAWFVMECPAFFVILICFLAGNKKTNPVAIIFLAMWLTHYFQRTFIYSFLIKSRKNTFPVLVMFFSIAFNVLNGYLNGRYLFYFSPDYDIRWLSDPRFISGTAIFITGYIINLVSDNILRNLRKSQIRGAYKVPHGALFKFVSSPNYFGEILEWTGWAIATWSLPGLAFAVFTIANLAPRAVANHRWYRSTFPEYPEDRKALIPFVL